MVLSGQRNGFNCVSRRADLGNCAIKLLLVGHDCPGTPFICSVEHVRDLLLCAKHLFVEAKVAAATHLSHCTGSRVRGGLRATRLFSEADGRIQIWRHAPPQDG